MSERPVDLEAVERRRFQHGHATPGDVDDLMSEVRRLREALAPFAGRSGHHTDPEPGETVLVLLSDCKRAKEVLGG